MTPNSIRYCRNHFRAFPSGSVPAQESRKPWWCRSSTLAPLGVLVAVLLAWPCIDVKAAPGGHGHGDRQGHGRGHGRPPNILFVIMDDVGIDQMASFGYGGRTPPSMPAIETIANEGIRFSNTWAMPACSTTRALLFTGRFPTRTKVNNAIGPSDLANSMVSPYETTTPRLLARRGYESALFGKFHLALQGENMAGFGLPHALGWDFFAGWLDPTGDPSSIDKTAGGVRRQADFTCGFVPGADQQGGADSGACYMANDSCTEMSSAGPVPPGRTCRDQGGIFVPERACRARPPSRVDFSTYSGHYVSPLVYNYPDGRIDQLEPTDPRSRRFRGQVVVDEAIEWIQQRPEHQPWMATVSFATAHTPVMQPPVEELHSVNGEESLLDCSDPLDQRQLTNLMIEAMDTEVARLLVETGLATHRNGILKYNPRATDTVLIILGDNGTLATAVKRPFDLGRAKGTAYQTGVWVPLIVAGPIVRSPDRDVPHMVNAADLYQLFGEIAGIDVHEAVDRPIDSEAMLPYLTDANPESIRDYNFAQVGPNLQANNGENGPCVIGSACTQIPPTKGVCEDNNGVWWGPDADAPGVPRGGVSNCCEVNKHLSRRPRRDTVTVLPGTSVAVRDDRFKLVQNTTVDWDPGEGACTELVDLEFYRINEKIPRPRLDRESLDLGDDPDDFNRVQARHFEALLGELDDVLLPDYGCEGDGNIDFVVDETDLENARSIAREWGGSSDYDFNLDGLTDAKDIRVVRKNLGTICPITVKGENDPSIDPYAVQAAVNLGVERGGEKGRVVLQGAFDFGDDCAGCIQVSGPVMIEGTRDPSGRRRPHPRLVTTIKSASRAPFVIQDDSTGEGRIRIERIWFRSAQTIALEVAKLSGELELVQNRFSGITGVSDRGTIRFAVGGAGVGPMAGQLRGRFRAVQNHIDTRNVPFRIGDDNGFAFAQCDFDSIEIRDNRIYTRGEGIEVEGCTNPKATIAIVGNELITDAAISNLAILTEPKVIKGIGGHPAVLKVIGTEAASVIISDNDVTLRGWHTAICIMPGLVNKKGKMLIQNNHCQMSGQFAAVLAGWAGTPGFFPPFYLQNSVVENNLFEGRAQYGVAFADFIFRLDSSANETNKGKRNLFEGNDFSGLYTSEAALFFGPSTRKNLFIGDPNGEVIDLGRNNRVLAD